MQKANELNKNAWFLNPWFDIIFLTTFPVVLFTPLMNTLNPQFSFSSDFLYVVLNLPHRISGLSIFVIFRREFKKKFHLYLGIILSILICTKIAFFFKFSLLIEIVRVVWAIGHDFTQHQQILGFSKIANGDNHEIDQRLDMLALTTGSIFCFFFTYST